MVQWSYMVRRGMVRYGYRMDGGGVVEGGCVVGNCMVDRSMVDRGSMVSNSVVDGSSMMSNAMVGYSMVDNCMVGVRVSHDRRWDNVSVLVQDGFGQVGIEQGVCVETVEGDGSAAVNCVPELAPGFKMRKLEEKYWGFAHLNRC